MAQLGAREDTAVARWALAATEAGMCMDRLEEDKEEEEEKEEKWEEVEVE